MLSDESYKKYKEISEKQGIKYKSNSELRDTADNLVGFFEILMEMDQEEQSYKRRLKSEPKGFSMRGNGRNCSLCNKSISEEGFYDKWGFKCMNCQDAINKKKIPGSLCGDYEHKKYMTDSVLSYKTGIHIQTIRKLIRQGKIKARKIPNGPYIITHKDNSNIQTIIHQEKRKEHLNKPKT